MGGTRVGGLRVAVGDDVDVGTCVGVSVGTEVSVQVGVSVGGMGVSVGGTGVSVGSTAVFVDGALVPVGWSATTIVVLTVGAGLGAGAPHALAETVSTNKPITQPRDF